MCIRAGAQAAKLQRLESEANADVAALRQVLSGPGGDHVGVKN